MKELNPHTILTDELVGWRGCVSIDIHDISKNTYVVYLHFKGGVRPEIAILSGYTKRFYWEITKYKEMIDEKYKILHKIL